MNNCYGCHTQAVCEVKDCKYSLKNRKVANILIDIDASITLQEAFDGLNNHKFDIKELGENENRYNVYLFKDHSDKLEFDIDYVPVGEENE